MAGKQLVLVDTSVFIDFFRGRNVPVFESLVEENRVVLSDLVRLELMIGVRKSELKTVMSALSGLIRSIPNPAIYGIAETLITRIRPEALTIGINDLLLAAEANLNGQVIMSHDKIFEKMALKGFIKTA